MSEPNYKRMFEMKQDDWLEACGEIDQLRQEKATVELELSKLRELAEKMAKELERYSIHYECEDCWYSCPKSDEGCCDVRAGTECNCGADSAQSALAEYEKLKERG